jgi:catecholate siderophore receptor
MLILIASSRLIAPFLILFVVSPLLCHAQVAGPRASLHGKVLDQNRAAIPGAKVLVEAKGHSASFAAIADQNGEFSLPLPPDDYLVSVIAAGFAEAAKTISVGPTNAASLEVVLQVAGSSTIVTVASDVAGYQTEVISSATKTFTLLRDTPQSIAVVTKEQIRDQSFQSITDVVNYIPGITAHQGENNRDQLVIRGNSTSADFYLNGVRDDVQYYRDLYNVDRVEALKGPNAMIFGRGGGGGVINRVTKEASFAPLREITLQGGSFRNRRGTVDFDQPLGNKVALRVNGLYENSDSFRFVGLERYGISPTLTIAPDQKTQITFGYEYFHDGRTADRGIPSFQGRPLDIPISTFFGNPNNSHVRATVNLLFGSIERQIGRFNLRNRAQFGDYDRGYQNYVAGAVTADKTRDSISAYNNATKRKNIFNQTDLTFALSTGSIRHTLLAGTEFGRQLTDNFRNTGFFNNTATSILVPLDNPTVSTPATFRQSATDADNHLVTNLAASYAQDQIEFSRFV